MTTTATHLRTCALHWADLHEALGAPAIHNGFGVGLHTHLKNVAHDETDLFYAIQDRIVERADSHDALGERPVPVRLRILDTMRTVETALVQCADDIAAAAQRAPITVPAARKADYRTLREARIAAADRERQQQLAHADQHDPRRWRWTGQRTAPYAALWLLARVERAPGPCRRITEQEEQHIGRVAEAAADRIERALDIAAQSRTLEQRHDCGGRIDVHGGEGRAPLAHCTGCGRIWSEGGVIAA